MNYKEVCQNCVCANTCIFYNDVHKAVRPYNDRERLPYVEAIVIKCSFLKKG